MTIEAGPPAGEQWSETVSSVESESQAEVTVASSTRLQPRNRFTPILGCGLVVALAAVGFLAKTVHDQSEALDKLKTSVEMDERLRSLPLPPLKKPATMGDLDDLHLDLVVQDSDIEDLAKRVSAIEDDPALDKEFLGQLPIDKLRECVNTYMDTVANAAGQGYSYYRC